MVPSEETSCVKGWPEEGAWAGELFSDVSEAGLGTMGSLG